MIGLVVGMLSVLVVALTDVALLRGWRCARPPMFVVSTLLLAFAIFDTCWRTSQFSVPFPTRQVGSVLVPLGGLLFVYSVFVEIPLAIKWKANPSSLVNTGTYALCRHPGVIWMGLLLIGLILVSRSTKLLVAAPVWLATDILWVLWQDRYVFPRLIPGYQDYQRETPILLPSRRSIKACLNTGLFRFKRKGISQSEGG